MMYEAELKFVIDDVDAVQATLRAASPPKAASYEDAYYDHPQLRLSARGAELRVRRISTPLGHRAVLTYKGGPVDAATDSKSEIEFVVESAEKAREFLEALGCELLVAFRKDCELYTLDFSGTPVEAALVTLPDIPGVFLELELLVSTPESVTPALDRLRQAALALGLRPDALTTAGYMDEVIRVRAEVSGTE